MAVSGRIEVGWGSLLGRSNHTATVGAAPVTQNEPGILAVIHAAVWQLSSGNHRIAVRAGSPPRRSWLFPDHTPWGSEPLALDPLALQLAGAANGLGSLAGAALRRLLIVPPQLHLAENPLPLHLLLERLQRLVDIVVTNENLHLAACSFLRWHPRRSGTHDSIPLAMAAAGGSRITRVCGLANVA
jgi:hypothetical protein